MSESKGKFIRVSVVISENSNDTQEVSFTQADPDWCGNLSSDFGAALGYCLLALRAHGISDIEEVLTEARARFSDG